MEIIDVRNPRYANAEMTAVDMDVLFKEHQSLGYLPFTAMPGDVEEHGQILYQNSIVGVYGSIAQFQGEENE